MFSTYEDKNHFPRVVNLELGSNFSKLQVKRYDSDARLFKEDYYYVVELLAGRNVMNFSSSWFRLLIDEIGLKENEALYIKDGNYIRLIPKEYIINNYSILHFGNSVDYS